MHKNTEYIKDDPSLELITQGKSRAKFQEIELQHVFSLSIKSVLEQN